MTFDEMSETDYNICMQAVIKCHLLRGWVDAGLVCTLTPKTFGFVTLTDEEEHVLIEKLYKRAQLAWLREQPKEII